MEFGPRRAQRMADSSSPNLLRADSSQIEDFLGRLKDAEMDATLSDEDAKKYAAAFAFCARRGHGGGDRSQRPAEAGGAQIQGRLLRQVQRDRGCVQTHCGRSHQILRQEAEDFRNKKIFDFGFNDPSKIEFKDGAKTIAVEKSGESWISSGKAPLGKAMDSISVQALIDKLRDLAASKLVDTDSPPRRFP